MVPIDRRPTAEHPNPRLAGMDGPARPPSGVVVVSPLPAFLFQLRQLDTDLVIAVGLTVDAAFWSLAGDALLRLVVVDALSLSTDRESVVQGLACLADVPSALFGDATVPEGRSVADENGIKHYFRRPDSAILFVAKLKHLLWLEASEKG